MEKLVILTGPTAVGKSSLSIKLAKTIGGEIISADCMQVYKNMNIGTAKITPQEMDGVKHYLIDCMEPTEEFHVVKFKELALKAMEEIYSNGKIPIVCGGTGFYIQALLYDIQFEEGQKDDILRASLEDFADLNGNEALLEKLKEIDPESAELIPANNRKRVIRAIEYFQITGEKISEHNKIERNRKSPYNFAYFVLNDDRKLLYERIDKRVDKMVSDGLIDEVMSLKNMGCHKGMTSMDGIGYKEILEAIDENKSIDSAIDLIKQNSRRYAKRQLTWFRREKDVIWLDRVDLKNDDIILEKIMFELKEKGII